MAEETPRPRQLDMEQIHEIANIISDALQTYMEKNEKPIGFLEMKIGMINAWECLYQYQHKIMVVGKPPQTDRDRMVC